MTATTSAQDPAVIALLMSAWVTFAAVFALVWARIEEWREKRRILKERRERIPLALKRWKS